MATRVLIHEWVTGGGLAGSPLPRGWAAEGRAMRRAVADDFHQVEGVEVVMTLDDRFHDEIHPFEVVSVDAGEETATLSRLASESDFTLVIAPETGGILADRARSIENAGRRSLGSTSTAVALTGEKMRLAEHLRRRGVRTIPSAVFRVEEGIPEGMTFPVVLKPSDGAGAQHTFLLNGPEDLARIAREWDGSSPLMVIQPYCPGDPLSATFLISPMGRVRLIGVGWQLIVVRDGLFRYQGGRLPADPEFADGAPTEAIRCVSGLRGVVGVDFLRDPRTGVATVVEINPRPTTSYVGLTRLLPPGTIARHWLDAFRGGETARDHAMIPARRGAVLIFRPDGALVEWGAAVDGSDGGNLARA